MPLLDQLSRSWRAYALIALVTLAAALPGFARIPVLDRDEARFAQATRQMLETGDFVSINVQDEPRNKKPIGIHWMQAASVAATEHLTGNNNTIWAYRLPSLLGIVLAALAAFWGGTALVSRKAAFLGAALFGTTLLATTEALIAKTDGMLTGLITLAMAALAHLRARPSKRLALVFWFAIGLGALVKGPVAPMVAGLTLIALFVWERRAAWMKPLVWWPGPMLAALLVLPWLVAIQLATDGAFLREAIVGDLAPKLAGGSEGHAGPPGYYLALVALLFFPATLGLAPGVALAVQQARAPREDAVAAPFRFLIAWIVPPWLVFEILPTKLPHYVLPTYPALALLAATGLLAAREKGWRVSPIASLVLFAFGGALLVALNAYGVTLMPGDDASNERRAIQTALMGGAGLAIVLAPMIWRKDALSRVALALLVLLVGNWSLRERIIPEARTVLISAELDAALERNGLADASLTVIGYRETSLAFMTRTDIHMLGEAAWHDAALHVPAGGALIVMCERTPEVETDLAKRALSFRRVATIRGRNYANGDDVCLDVGRIT